MRGCAGFVFLTAVVEPEYKQYGKRLTRVGAVRCVLLAAVVRVGDVQVDWARLLRVLIVDSSLEVTCS